MMNAVSTEWEQYMSFSEACSRTGDHNKKSLEYFLIIISVFFYSP